MSPHRTEWVVIGISGVTCGGKTMLSHKLLEHVAEVRVLHQDKYFLPDEHARHVLVPGLLPAHNNYDILSALDMSQMHRDALAIIEGAEVAHSCGGAARPGVLRLPARKVLVVEGFTAINYRPLYDLCDIRYYFVLEYEECLARRALRHYDPPDVPGYFERCVWPEHLRHRAQLEQDPNVKIVDGRRNDTLEMVVSDLRALGAERVPGDT